MRKISSTLGILFTLVFSLCSGAAEADRVAYFQQRAAEDKVRIEVISKKTSFAIEDLETLAVYIHRGGVSGVATPGQIYYEVVSLARETFAKIAYDKKDLFYAYLQRHTVELQTHPHRVTDFIITSMNYAPNMLPMLAERNLIVSDAILLSFGVYSHYRIDNGDLWMDWGMANKSKAMQLVEANKIAAALVQAGVYTREIEEKIVEGLASGSISAEVKLSTIDSVVSYLTRPNGDFGADKAHELRENLLRIAGLNRSISRTLRSLISDCAKLLGSGR